MAHEPSAGLGPDERSSVAWVARGGAWALGGKFIAAISAMAVNALLARYLSPDDLGAYFVAVSLVTIGATIGVLGVDAAAVRLIASRYADSDRADRRAYLALVLIVAVAGACVAAFAYRSLSPSIAHVFGTGALVHVSVALAIWIVLAALQRVMTEVFRGYRDIRMATLLAGVGTKGGGILVGLLMPVGVIALALADRVSFAGVVFVAAGASGIVVLAGFARLVAREPRLWQSFRRIGWHRVRVLSGISLPILGSSVLVGLRMQSDIWILGTFGEPQLVAQYGAALRLVTLVVTPLLVLNAVVPPLVSRFHRGGEMRRLETTLRAAATLVSVPSLVALVVLAWWGGPLLGLVYGDFYRGAASVLLILCVGQAVNVFAGSCGMTLIYTDYQSAYMVITLVSTLVVVLLGIALVPVHGAVGMAVASSLGLIVQNGLAVAVVRRGLGIWTHLWLTPLGLRQAVALIRKRGQ